jgi:hypothetical protein
LAVPGTFLSSLFSSTFHIDDSGRISRNVRSDTASTGALDVPDVPESRPPVSNPEANDSRDNLSRWGVRMRVLGCSMGF